MGLAMAEACVENYKHLPDTNAARWWSLDYTAAINIDIGNNDTVLILFNRLLEIYKIVTEQGWDIRRIEIKSSWRYGFGLWENGTIR